MPPNRCSSAGTSKTKRAERECFRLLNPNIPTPNTRASQQQQQQQQKQQLACTYHSGSHYIHLSQAGSSSTGWGADSSSSSAYVRKRLQPPHGQAGSIPSTYHNMLDTPSRLRILALAEARIAERSAQAFAITPAHPACQQPRSRS